MMPVLPPPRDPPKVPVARWLARSLGALLLTAGALAAGALAAEDPADLLARRFQLTKVAGGDFWLLPGELQLQESLGELEPARRSIAHLEKILQERGLQNRIAWELNQPRIEVLRRSLSRLESDDPQQRQIEQQIRELQTQAVPPAELAAVPDVRAQLVELINQRLHLALLVVSTRRLQAEVSQEYQRLAEDPAVRTALAALGPTHRLGPLQQGYRGPLRRLAKYEQIVGVPWVPIYCQSERVRFGGIIDDCLPVMFSWGESGQPTLVTSSMLQASGLALPETAETVPLSLPGRTAVMARAAILPSLRFGGAQLHDLPVLVLPPEGEDVGARISPEAFSQAGYRVELQPERLRLVIDP